MGLLTKEVEVRLVAQNISYYENLGYKIPRKPNRDGYMCVPQNTTIIVSIDDLPLGSGVYVDLECDCCHKHYKLKYQNYNNHNHNGKTYCKHCFSKVFLKGELNPNYNFNLTDEDRVRSREYEEYVKFVKSVLIGNNYTCQCCRQHGGDLEVHHLDGYDWCVEKRTDVTNGITLCKKCHKAFHSIYGYGKNTKEQFEKWLGRAIELIFNEIELESNRKVYCYEDDIIFDSVENCASYYEVTRQCIYNALKGKVMLAVSRHFIWCDKYLNMSENDKKKWLKQIPKGKQVVCITTGEIFEQVQQANEKYNVKISSCLSSKRKSAGKLTDGTPLQWMYYEDFLKLPIEEQNKILESNKDSSKDGSFVNYKNNESEGMINNVN